MSSIGDSLGRDLAILTVALLVSAGGLTAAFFLWPFWHVMGGLACLALVGLGAWYLLADRQWRIGP